MTRREFLVAGAALTICALTAGLDDDEEDPPMSRETRRDVALMIVGAVVIALSTHPWLAG